MNYRGVVWVLFVIKKYQSNLRILSCIYKTNDIICNWMLDDKNSTRK